MPIRLKTGLEAKLVEPRLKKKKTFKKETLEKVDVNFVPSERCDLKLAVGYLALPLLQIKSLFNNLIHFKKKVDAKSGDMFPKCGHRVFHKN